MNKRERAQIKKEHFRRLFGIRRRKPLIWNGKHTEKGRRYLGI